ncbi:DoxX family protein [Rhizobium rhizogenes]|uniref:DoxX family protein n=1 Tax=Rhizobium rhizogenes TaxID=359 RepID=UPI0022C68604|nr:DoxX family protein [Rhizobium rhizogenes]MCZ7466613.1 DoxX family protein [Rhizobium rhizogenes]
MAAFDNLSRYRPYALAALRIIAALLFIEHGTQKLFGFPASQMEGSLPTLMLVAALLELVGGILVLIGLFTRPVAFILSGQMAVAYFMAHAPSSFFPALNGGDAAILFCFVFLYFVFAGPGAFSVDERRA